ncbi:contactin [Euwallacea similis]|uniref:contactin n=1 Tax=Euwallacea similis TaxID=1736056 RepID=UPI00344DF52A
MVHPQWSILFVIFCNSPVINSKHVSESDSLVDPHIGLNSLGSNFQNYERDYVGHLSGSEFECPEHWVLFQHYCYKFIKSPRKSYVDSRLLCQAMAGEQAEKNPSDLVSISSIEEHSFLVQHLNRYDPQHRRWYVGAHQTSPNLYINPDGTQLPPMESAFIKEHALPDGYETNFLVYTFSDKSMHWGLQPVDGNELFPFICKANVASVERLRAEQRNFAYGTEIFDPEKVPRGPYFVKQPADAIFDMSKRNLYNDISLTCLAGGYPTPTYKWYREEYENDVLVPREIDPLMDQRYTITGGTLIIHDPQQKLDRTTYHCRASNKFGTIISESININFGFILEFVLKRSPEVGDLNWGRAIYCDPPNHFPSVKYSWSREYFPNFVEEDRRVFVSNDGALYFSALETIDRANYSCSIQSEFSDSGRNGPFFPLRVNPHSNYQTLKFPNNFPKSFPDTPIAGKEVRLECVAFGYPVPSYNWTRKGSVGFPRNAYFTSFNRVLIIPYVRVEDEGEYTCRAYNDRQSIENSVVLNIQAEPNFTIPLSDKHIDKKGELVWTCEAFGIPDVNYTFFKDGKQLSVLNLDPEDRGRINIKDNVLTINYLNDQRDPGMYQCSASNTLKTRYSSAQLRVLAFPPTFKKKPLESETYAAEGGNVTIKCRPEAAPKPRFVWKKDGIEIGPGGHRRMFESGNLLLSPVSRDDEGVYSCTAINELGIAESKGRLIVLREPRIVESPGPTIVTVNGRNLDLQCYAISDEMLDIAYVWTHNGLRIRADEIFNSANKIKIDGGYLRIANSTFSDSGDYECLIESAVGVISSKTRVVVQGPPGPPGGVQVMSMQKNSFVLQWTDGATHGMPVYSYSISGRTNWNNTWVTVAVGVRAREIDRFTGRKEADVEVSLTPWSNYEFRIRAWNELGQGPYSAPSPKYHTLKDRPRIAPRQLGGGGGKIGDLTITWNSLRPEEQHAPGIHYKVFWKRYNDQLEFQSEVLKEFGSINKAVVQIEPKFYYTKYLVKVQAINEIGPGPISAEALIFSAEDMPQVAPQLVLAKSYNSTALNVSWEPIEEIREKIKGKLIGHRIKYWRKDTREEDSVYYLSRTTRPWALIVGLQPDTYYFVKCMAYNGAGEGPESERYLERTFRKAPQKPPSSVRVYGINPSTINVQWRYVQPSLEEEPLQGYKIRIWEFDQDLSTANDTIVPFGGHLEGYVNGLSPGKTYRMRVLAYSNGGDGRMSSPELVFQMGNPQYFRSSSPRESGSATCLKALIASLNVIVLYRI